MAKAPVQVTSSGNQRAQEQMSGDEQHNYGVLKAKGFSDSEAAHSATNPAGRLDAINNSDYKGSSNANDHKVRGNK